MFKRITALFTALLTTLPPAITAVPVFAAEPPGMCYILTEAGSGMILDARDADKKVSIASVTKLMLLLIVTDMLSGGELTLDDVVTASPKASGIEGSSIWLVSGETMTLRDLIKSVVIASANDAAYAIAEHIAGDEASFVALMNERANQLGMKNTHFQNCAGFDSPLHYSTARDVAVMTAALFSKLVPPGYIPQDSGGGKALTFRDELYIFFHTRLDYVRAGTEHSAQLLNTNKLANSYAGLLGGKTGTTDGAGYCLAAVAARNGLRAVAVVLGAPNEETRVNVSRGLLDKAFAEFETETPGIDAEKLAPVAVTRGVMKSVRVLPANVTSFVIPRGTAGSIEYVYALPKEVSAPVRRGQKIGKVQAVIGGKLVFESDIIAFESVEELTFIKSFTILLESLLRI